MINNFALFFSATDEKTPDKQLLQYETVCNNEVCVLSGCPYSGVFQQVQPSQKKRNQTIEFSWGLYCLVVLFLLVYVICASIPTEGTVKQGLTVLKTPHSLCSSHIFKMSDFKDQLFTCAGLPSDNIVEFSCGKKLFWKLILIFSC